MKKKNNVRSPMNHLGNKFRIMNILNETFDFLSNEYTFIDVFGGSGVVSANSKFHEVYYNEYDENIFNITKTFFEEDGNHILSQVKKVASRYNLLQGSIHNYIDNKEGFLKLRKKYNDDKIKDIYKLIVLVIYGFNSQIRFNKSGHFNIPLGKSGLTSYREQNIIKFSELSKFKKIHCYNMDFFDFTKHICDKIRGVEKIFYFDPPYLVSNATYNSNWTEENEMSLIGLLGWLDKEGYKFVLSNFLYNGTQKNVYLEMFLNDNNFFVKEVNVNYARSNYQRKNKKSKEIIVRNF